MFLTGNIKIVIPFFNPYPQFPKSIRDKTQLADIDILNGYLGTGHSSQSDITTHFNHIRQTTMPATVQFLYPFNCQ